MRGTAVAHALRCLETLTRAMNERVVLTLRYKAPGELLGMDLGILNYGQLTRMTPLSPNFHTTSTGGYLSLNRFNVQWSPLHGSELGTRFELMTSWPQARDHNH
ncbi:hypothetical protein TNCV_4272471 [Trichonephila clavipes]|nr:hypothetical protein TNCV_4272471 [Trichonephila clavipes]